MKKQFLLSLLFASLATSKLGFTAQSLAEADNSSVLCIHSRVKQEGQRSGHAWVSFYDAIERQAKEFHFGRYEGSQFQVRSISLAVWRERSIKRDDVSRAHCLSIGPNQVESLLTQVEEVKTEHRPYQLTSNNCTTVAISIWNAGVPPSEKILRTIMPSILYNRL